MDKIKCEVIRDLMPLVADDVASAESKELVDGHMEGCETCRAYYAGMTAQLARMAMPDDGPTSTFVDFSHKMEKRVRMKKVITALIAAIVALCVVVVGISWISVKMSEWVYMPTENAQAWLYRESDGEVRVLVKMADGYGWYDWLGVNKRDAVLWLTPYEPALKLWNQGKPGFNEPNSLFGDGIYWEDGVLYYSLVEWHNIYNEELEYYIEEPQERKIPVDLIRWGHENDFTTLYEAGDEVPTYTELMAQLEAEGIVEQTSFKTSAPDATMAPTATAIPFASPEVTMEAKLLG